MVPFLVFITAIVSSLYIIVDWQGIAERAGVLLTRDMVIGVILVIALLEAARRKIGVALVITALCFIFYAFFASYFPGVFAFNSVSLSEFFNQTVFSFEGIYGVPLGISVSTIYLFVLLGPLLERAGVGKVLH